LIAAQAARVGCAEPEAARISKITLVLALMPTLENFRDSLKTCEDPEAFRRLVCHGSTNSEASASDYQKLTGILVRSNKLAAPDAAKRHTNLHHCARDCYGIGKLFNGHINIVRFAGSIAFLLKIFQCKKN
jgi:hypothetical protein